MSVDGRLDPTTMHSFAVGAIAEGETARLRTVDDCKCKWMAKNAFRHHQPTASSRFHSLRFRSNADSTWVCLSSSVLVLVECDGLDVAECFPSARRL